MTYSLLIVGKSCVLLKKKTRHFLSRLAKKVFNYEFENNKIKLRWKEKDAKIVANMVTSLTIVLISQQEEGKMTRAMGKGEK